MLGSQRTSVTTAVADARLPLCFCRIRCWPTSQMGQKLRKLDASICFPLRKRTSSAKPATSENLHKLRRGRDRPNRTCRHAACTIPPTCLDSHLNDGETSRNIRSKTKPPLSRPMPLDTASQLSVSTRTKAAAGCGWIAARRSTASQGHYQRKPIFSAR